MTTKSKHLLTATLWNLLVIVGFVACVVELINQGDQWLAYAASVIACSAKARLATEDKSQT